MKKILFLAPIVVLSACTSLRLPDNWREINAEAYENASFKEMADSIDPEQTWNLAQDLYFMSEGEFYMEDELSESSVGTKALGLKDNIEDNRRQKADGADYFVASSGFYVHLDGVKGDADSYSVGIYYTTEKKGVKEYHETYMWEDINKDNFKDKYNSLTKRKWTSTDYEHKSSFGFFLKSRYGKDEHVYYSERSRNGAYTGLTTKMYDAGAGLGPYWVFLDDGFPQSYSSFRAITLEITSANVTPFVVKPLDYDRGPWMVICEDVGSEADNDFNDVVFIVHRPDATHIKVELVAAGATRINNLYFGDTLIGEVHQLFGINDVTRMINTYKGADGEVGKTSDNVPSYMSDPIEVDKSFTMASDNMGGFRITSNNEASVIYASPEQKGHGPFMICVPATDFNWAVEQVSIFEAYPEFATWVANREQATDWYQHPVAGKVYVRE